MLEYLRKDVQEWLNRSLETYYPVLFIDCVHIKIHSKRSGIDRNEVDAAMKQLKAEGAIVSPIRCKWAPAE